MENHQVTLYVQPVVGYVMDPELAKTQNILTATPLVKAVQITTRGTGFQNKERGATRVVFLSKDPDCTNTFSGRCILAKGSVGTADWCSVLSAYPIDSSSEPSSGYHGNMVYKLVEDCHFPISLLPSGPSENYVAGGSSIRSAYTVSVRA